MVEWLTTEDVAERLNYTEQWVRTLARTGQLRAYRGRKNHFLFHPKDVSAFEKEHPSDTHPVAVKGSEN